MNVLWSFLTKIKCSSIFNQDLGKTIQLIFAWFIWLTKYSTDSNDFNRPLKSIWYYRSKLQKLPSFWFSYEGIDRFRPYLLSRKFSENCRIKMQSSRRIHSWTFIIFTIFQRYTTGRRLWSVSLCSRYMLAIST